jgi:hypothetical protein
MLIGIAGKAFSGKDTVANWLCARYGFEVMRIVDPLKKMAAELFFMSDDQLNGADKEVVDSRYGFTPRYLLQYLGTDVFKKLYKNVWVDHLVARYTDAASPNIAVPDVRFPEEVEEIRKLTGSSLWKVKRSDHTGASGGIESHASEQDLPDELFDVVISAKSGDVNSIYDQAENFFKAHQRRTTQRRKGD